MGITEMDGNVKSIASDDCEIISVNLKMRGLLNILKPIRPFLIFGELILRFLWIARKYNPKIIHCHDTVVLPIGLILSIFNKSKLIYDAHELESNRNSQGKISSMITWTIEKISWKKIDLLISVSPSINQWYIDEFGDKNNILILNSPQIGHSFEEKKVFRLREKLNILKSEKIFVYLGIFAKGRGIERALKVFSRHDVDAHILFVGWGILETMIKKYSQDNKNIHVHAPVDHSEVVPLVSECDFGICNVENISLSDYLCLPNKLFEYCFAGLPVLTSNFPELSRVVEEHDIGITCDNSEDEMYSAISKLVSKENKFTFKNIEILSWETQAKRLSNTYKTLITNK